MEEEKKKSKVGIIILIIIILLLILFAVWYFLLRDKGETNNNNNNNNQQQEKPKKDDEKDDNGYEYDYRDGVLTPIVDKDGNPKQTEFVIDGIILIGNRHSYFDTDDTETVLDNFVQQGYKKEGINSSFYLNEHIEIYLDTKYNGPEENVVMLITPHKTVAEYEKMTYEELTDLGKDEGSYNDYTTPDSENHKFVNDPYVSMDYPEGKYDLLFVYKEKLAYFVTLDLVKEPTE